MDLLRELLEITDQKRIVTEDIGIFQSLADILIDDNLKDYSNTAIFLAYLIAVAVSMPVWNAVDLVKKWFKDRQFNKSFNAKVKKQVNDLTADEITDIKNHVDEMIEAMNAKDEQRLIRALKLMKKVQQKYSIKIFDISDDI